ncbi:cuticle protein 10.9-like [Varroa jacobsoni]|uniref:Cuticle protein n=1 Tax=Varroa destructor TaxID=109461 RepID=A0A7M7JPW1_VARDE|nr:adult-specific rigid cuticular protein 15.5-like [Varroa destructor]XP_022706377.1 cuticle protein 10.9-like [Varroa jacobsoni]
MFKALVLSAVSATALAGHHYTPLYATSSHFQPLYTAAANVKEVHEEPVYAPQPYSFGYDTVDEYGNKQFRQETSDANNAKRGSYGYTDADGIYRRVDYVADAAGFRATISTNEPGTKAGQSADAVFNAPEGVKTSAPVVKAASAYLAPTYVAPAYAPAVKPGYGFGYRKRA